MPKEQESKEARVFDPEGLILPKKLPNPNVESREKKDLHKEMLWKMKFGSNDPKDCELQKAYANMANRQRLKEIELEKANQMTFEKLLEEQRQRLHSVGTKSTGSNEDLDEAVDSVVTHSEEPPSGTTNVTNTTTTTTSLPSKNEFLRVFSKVRAKNSDALGIEAALEQRTKAV